MELNEQERAAVEELILFLGNEASEDEIQSAVFNVSRNNDIKPGKFFKTLYKILLGSPHGPRFGPYVLAMGRENVIDALKRATKVKS
jgi:lysyl-tRNA synthetase class 1